MVNLILFTILVLASQALPLYAAKRDEWEVAMITALGTLMFAPLVFAGVLGLI